MSIHFIYVILESDAYYYSSYMELLHLLVKNYSRINPIYFSILWDSDKAKQSIIHHFEPHGNTCIKIDRTMDINKNIASFVNNSYELFQSTIKIFTFYCHGNIWFFRHDNKISPFSSLFSKLKYKFDIIFLECCYTASIENCIELKDKATLLITSEYKHSRCLCLDLNCILDIKHILYNSTSNVLTLIAIALASTYINKINAISFYDSDVLSLDSDIVIIDLTNFQHLYHVLKKINLNNLTHDAYKNSKLNSVISSKNIGYDIYHAINLDDTNNINDKNIFFEIFNKTIIYYKQSNLLQNKKNAHRMHGLNWSPAPYDSEHGWTYKYTNIFPDHNLFTIYK